MRVDAETRRKGESLRRFADKTIVNFIPRLLLLVVLIRLQFTILFNCRLNKLLISALSRVTASLKKRKEIRERKWMLELTGKDDVILRTQVERFPSDFRPRYQFSFAANLQIRIPAWLVGWFA